MSLTDKFSNKKYYSNTSLFEKREKEFKLKKINDSKNKENKKYKYNWIKKLIKKNSNFSFPVLSISTAYINSDANKQLNLRNKILKRSLINKKRNNLKSREKSNKIISSKMYSTFLKDNNINKLYKKIIVKRNEEKNKSINNEQNFTNFNYFLFNNFRSSPNSDILIHFQSEKNLYNNKADSELSFNKYSFNRIKSAENNKKITFKNDTGNKFINKTIKYKKIQYSSKIKKERELIIKENNLNEIESYNDILRSFDKAKHLLNFKFIDKMSNYIKFINSKIELEKNKNEVLMKEIITYKEEFKILNNKIKKKHNERNDILKWIYFQIQLKERKMYLPSYYRLIIEYNETKKVKNEDMHVGKKKTFKSTKNLFKRLYITSPKIYDNKILHINSNEYNNDLKGLFYKCELNLEDKANINEVNKLKKYKNNLIYKSVEEFFDTFNFLEKNIISMMKYYYKLKMKIYYWKKELNKETKNTEQNIINYEYSVIKKEKEFNQIKNYIKDNDKIINKYNIYYKYLFNKEEDNNEIIVLYGKINILYNSCKSLKINYKETKENNENKKVLNFQSNKILIKLKYITFILDYLLVKFNEYKKRNNELLNKLRNEIEKKHKMQKAAEQRVKDIENIIKLEKKIEERNNKIYFLPYKKIESYNNKRNYNNGNLSSKRNKKKNIQFNELIYGK